MRSYKYKRPKSRKTSKYQLPSMAIYSYSIYLDYLYTSIVLINLVVYITIINNIAHSLITLNFQIYSYILSNYPL